ncbi:MAG: SDR family oxidoreductase [Litoreibacter sp.]|nr:SDR family oxidoreductase [Litoreibacter sp.]
MTRPTVLITGASAGIGAATAQLAARAGYDVAIHYNSDRDGAARVAETVEKEGGSALLIQGDVSNSEDISRMFLEFDAQFSRMDALVNNAGIVDRSSRVDQMTPERLERIISVNLTGAILVAKEGVLRMSTAHGGQGGAIVNLSSVAAVLGAANQYVDYAAAKAGIDTLTKGLAHEVATEGVRVNAVRPGIIDTEIHAKGGLPNRAVDLAPLVPMKRAGTAIEVAEAILWLLSDKASYVTGTVLDVSGGR